MVIQCENCRRKYRLDNSRIKPPGSSVRCSKCGHIFFVEKKQTPETDDNLRTSEKTPLFENLNEEVAQEKAGSLEEEKAEEISETPPDGTEAAIGIIEKSNEEDNETVDIPTEHQVDLEEYINQQTIEDGDSERESEEISIKEKERAESETDTEIEGIYNPTESSPDLFDVEQSDTVDPDLEESITDKSFEEERDEGTTELVLEDGDSIALERDNAIIDNTDQLDLNDAGSETSEDIAEKKLVKSKTGTFIKFIYTLITIAAIFVIFVASLVILINAEILPKGTLSGLTTSIESIIPIGLNEEKIPKIMISEHKGRWMNTVNGPVYIVSGLITNESDVPVHYVKLKSEYIAAEKKQYEDSFYAGNTFTDTELKISPIQNILYKLDQKNGDIDINNSRKLAGLNYNIQPGESIPFFTVFPADSRVLGLRYNLEVIDYKEASRN